MISHHIIYWRVPTRLLFCRLPENSEQLAVSSEQLFSQALRLDGFFR
ncbi:MAG: hypothetical protein IKI11_11595 [Neisseriaceae bacterium]|nr:hypothetical protein [Neisseriaceae bacterium]